MTTNLSPYFCDKNLPLGRTELDEQFDHLHHLTDGKFCGLDISCSHLHPKGVAQNEPQSISTHAHIDGRTLLIYHKDPVAPSLTSKLPEDDTTAAAIGRLIQTVMFGHFVQDSIERIVSKYPHWAHDKETSALLTRNCMILFKEDVSRIFKRHHPKASKLNASMLLCTIIPRQAHSEHEKLAISQGIARDIEVFRFFQEDEIDLLSRENAKFVAPSVTEIAAQL